MSTDHISTVPRARGLTRSELLMLVYVVLFANAIVPAIVVGLATDGLIYSVVNTFEISAIVWIAFGLAVNLGVNDDASPIRRMDVVMASVAVAVAALPLGPGMWVALSLAVLYGIVTADAARGRAQRAAWLFLAISFPMFWSKRLFNIFSDFFLSIDARLVSMITQTERTANLVAIPGGSGYLEIAAACSSMANVSLAVLAWVMFTQHTALRWTPRNILWCGAACAVVVAINVTRISLIGFFPQHYDILHGGIGNTIASWATIFTVLGICNTGVQYERARLDAI